MGKTEELSTGKPGEKDDLQSALADNRSNAVLKRFE